MLDLIAAIVSGISFIVLNVSGQSFPPPLGAEEERELFRRLRAGGAQAEDEARTKLIEHNLRLIAHIVRKYYSAQGCSDDLISIGTIGLIKAITTFDPTRNNRLAAYASKCIHNEILMMLRAKKKTSKDVSLYQSIGTDKEGNEICLYDVLEASDHDIHDKMILKENTRLLYQHMEQLLTEREQYVLRMRYGLFQGKEYTQREIAQELGISRSYISRIEKSAIEKLRKHFQDD